MTPTSITQQTGAVPRQEPSKLDPAQRVKSFDEIYGTLAPHQAIAESARCLFCYDAPCNAGCPAGIDVASFIRSIKVRNFIGAARKIREKNVLAGICGRVCPAEKFCEENCSRTQLTEPINIKALHRFAVEIEFQRGLRPPETTAPNKNRVAVIGSGPSGLSCAAELTKLGYGVTIFEEHPTASLILTSGIPPHKLPKELVQAEINYLTKLGVQFKFKCSLQGRTAIDELFEGGYGAVFVGVGLGRPMELEMPGAYLNGVYTWMEVLVGANKLYSQTRGNNAPDLGKRVVVVGGGNVAIDVAASALRLKAEEVHLVCLEAIDEMPAFRSEISDALEEGVITHPRSRVLRIVERDRGKVGGVECIGIKWKRANDFTSDNAVPIDGTGFTLEADCVVVAIGQSLDEEKDQFLSMLRVAEGRIVVDPETHETSRKGVFAGGDAVRGAGTIVESVRDGAIAAKGISQYFDRPKGSRR